MEVKKSVPTRKKAILRGKKLEGHFTGRQNIAHLLLDAARETENGVTFIMDSKEERTLTYREIERRAMLRLGGLQQHGVGEGQYALIVLDDNEDFVLTFWACVLGGIIPVPLAYPSLTNASNATLDKLRAIWQTLERPVIVTDGKLLDNGEHLFDKVENGSFEMLDNKVLEQSDEPGEMRLAQPHTPAFIQFSSGSTNDPKGVILTHDNLLTNIDQIVAAAMLTDQDRSLSWMPYHHDMGLIGFHITMTAIKVQQFNMTPFRFVKRPLLWLEMLAKHKITITGSPNFGYRILLERVKKEQIHGLDFSHLRLIFNGAEPISVSLMRAFMSFLAPSGLRENAMYTVYGMAEACLAVSFPPCGSTPKVLAVDRKDFVAKSRARLVREDHPDALLLADEGNPMPGMQIRIVNERGNVVSEGTLGEIQIAGRNVTSGYVNNPSATEQLIQNGWLSTGDTGFVLDGRLIVAGRIKDLIFVNGQNVFAHDIEAAIEGLDGVKPGKMVVAGWHDEREGREKVALFSNQRVKDGAFLDFYGQILRHVNETMGIPIDEVVLVQGIPKTTSGKLQRYRLVADVRSGACDGRRFPRAHFAAEQPDLPEASNEAPARKRASGQPGEYLSAIREAWGKVLGRSPETIDPDTPFMSLGGTSLKAIQVLSELEESIGLALSHDILIQCRTIREMDAFLADLRHDDGQTTDGPNRLTARNRERPAATSDIAVIAMACRFPDASTPEQLWENLIHNKVSIGQIPDGRWDVDEYYRPEPAFGYTYCRSGAFLEAPYGFDAALFGISEEEAAVMDPQQRIMLELVHELIERSGSNMRKFSGSRTGLFVGAGVNAFLEYHLGTLNRLGLERMDSFAGLSEQQKEDLLQEWKDKFGETRQHPNLLVGNLLNMIAARASQEFNLTGPSLVIDTACSSSLVAIHMACESLRKGESDIAIAGGVNLLLTPTPYLYFSNSGALSASGQSRVFDAEADGFVPGEGAGLVMLKPLSKAMADKDEIMAVIKASAINNDGHSIGVMAPNPEGQKQVIQSVYADSGLHPGSIQYIEAHGTGTKVGDPSEVRALDHAFKPWNVDKQSIAIGSVKSNIGHLLGAAGVASFIKTVMALRSKVIPPSEGIRTVNPLLKLAQTPFRLPADPTEWTVGEQEARRASINSFGFGGTNCHMVLEEAPAKVTENPDGVTEPEPGRHLLCLSAHTESALVNRRQQLSEYMMRHPDVSLGELCYSENSRTAYKYRAVSLAESVPELLDQLQAKRAQEDWAIPAAKPAKIALMFTGQGAQYVGMAKQLYERLPAFREVVDACSSAFEPYLGTSVTDLLYGEEAREDRLASTEWTQPVVFTIDYALGRLLLDMGVKPAFVMGHSVGEWVAACLAGSVTLQDAAKLVAIRGKLMGDIQSGGSMAAVFVSRDKVEAMLEPYRDELWVAGYNVTHQVVSGKTAAMERFVADMAEQQVLCKRLNVSQAFHTPLMSPMLDAFRRELNQVTFNKPVIPVISNVTGQRMDQPADPDYWLNHVLAPVRFEQGLEHVLEQGATILLECGPDDVLARMANGLEKPETVKVLSAIRRKGDNLDHFLGTLGALFKLGLELDWDVFFAGTGYRKLTLPSYPYERIHYGPIAPGNDNQRSATREGALPSFHEWAWKEAGESRHDELDSGVIVVFGHDERLAEQLGKLAGPNRKICEIASGETFEQREPGRFTLNPGVPEHIAELFDRLTDPIAAVVHLWNAEQHAEADPLAAACSIIHIVNELENRSEVDPRLVLVTDKAVVIDGQDDVGHPHQAIATTFAQVLQQESRPRLSVLDVDFASFEGDRHGLAGAIWNEMMSDVADEALVALRHGKRWVRSIRKAKPAPWRNLEIRDGETYVITGGAGDIGCAIAKVLAEQANVNFVFAGRTPHPQLSDARKERLAALRSLGSEVAYYAVDVSDEAAVLAWLEQVRRQFGPIHGVVHAAGVVDEAGTRLKDRSMPQIARVLTPKVQGTVHLDMATRQDPLKFFVLLSSISATKQEWAAGLGDYAAANAFLDAYSFHRSRHPQAPGVSLAINYSLWANTGVGHAFGSLSALALKRYGLEPLKPTEAAPAFLLALQTAARPVVHLFDQVDSPRQAERISALVDAEKEIAASLEAGIVRESGPVPSMSAEDIRHMVRQAVCEYTGMEAEQLDEGANFQVLGVDSLGAMRIIDQLGQRLHTVLYPTLLFEYQTPDALAHYLVETCAERTSDQSGEGPIQMLAPDERQLSVVQETRDIAIIGMALRMPGASRLEQYWQILLQGKSMIREVPADRWIVEDVMPDAGGERASRRRRGGFLERPYDFDPLFFGISPGEAEVMDPQQRIFLEIAWEALQQAGYGGRHRPDRIGVYVGCEQNGYMDHFTGYCIYQSIRNKMENTAAFRKLSVADREALLQKIGEILQPSELTADAVAGNGLNEIAARVSHCLNLTGPSMAINTACSSSLVALHMACEGLKSGQMDMALAGGVHLNLNAMPFISLSRLTALSPDGFCAPFDRRANGMVLSEGAGVVLLKPLHKALQDKDHIFAVIKGSAINNDGRSQGITAPRPQGQAEAIRTAYERSGIHPETVSYIEAHGTATPLGDPIELEGMTQAFRHFTDKNTFCGIGSVKSSIGHMLAASGMASLIKVVLAMRNRTLPHTVNYEEPNPNIDFASSPFYVVSHQPRPWLPDGSGPLRAAVNAFGFGGTNAHVILEEAPEHAAGSGTPTHEGRPQLVVLSGRTGEGLERIADQLIAYRKTNRQVSLASLCHSLNISQKTMAEKAAFIIRSDRELLDRLEAIRQGSTDAHIVHGRSNPNRETPLHLAFGDEFDWNESWAEQLSARFPVYAAALKRTREALHAHWPTQEMSGEERQQVTHVAALVALGNLFSHLGLQPKSLVCEGAGHLVAGLLSGTLSPGQAVAILRGSGEVHMNQAKEGFGWSCFKGMPVHALGGPDDQAGSRVADREVVVVLGRMALPGCRGHVVTLPQEGDRDFDGVISVLTVLAKCYAAGVGFDLARLSEGIGKTPLPTYPFEHGVFKAKRFHAGLKSGTDDRYAPSATGQDGIREQANHLEVERLKRDLQLLGVPVGREGERA